MVTVKIEIFDRDLQKDIRDEEHASESIDKFRIGLSKIYNKSQTYYLIASLPRLSAPLCDPF